MRGLNCPSTVTCWGLCAEHQVCYDRKSHSSPPGELCLAQNGAERGTAWQLMAGLGLPCLASRSVLCQAQNHAVPRSATFCAKHSSIDDQERLLLV